MLPKIRLGKRSPLGALVCPSLEGHLDPGMNGDQDGGVATITMATGPGPQATGKIKLHPGQKVYLQCGGRECSGVVEQHNHIDNQVSVLLPALRQHVLRKTEDVWTSSPSSSSSAPLLSGRVHPVSSCIDVPRSQRSPEEVDVDEMMAAMVLSSLSCSSLLHSPLLHSPLLHSPLLHSPLLHSPRDTAAPCMECGGEELSDSGSSGYWSVGHGNRSPAPSPPITEPNSGLTTPSDEGMDMELEQVLFDEPAPRKRRNSVKMAYRCLWPGCGKVLTSVVGIKRHVRTLHLGQNGEHERCSRREEDFYYTEVHQQGQHPHTSCPGSASSPPSPPLPPGAGGPDSPVDGAPRTGPLSRSAPSGSLWQVQSEHSYQAPPPVHVASPAATNLQTSCRSTTPTTGSHIKQARARRGQEMS
ncbi:zinc finger protein 395a isoform 2-T2 [Polymixia lowei]